MADGIVSRIDQVEHPAQNERLFNALGLVAASTASGLSIREGRRLGAGLECTISGDGLSVIVQPGVCSVRHAVATGGDYTAVIPDVRTKALAAKPGVGLKRRDTVAVDVSDEDATEKPTTLRECNIVVLSGTATSGTPTAPAAGLMQFEIGQVAFDGTNTPTIHPTLPRYTWAAGGVGVVPSVAERDGLAAYSGMKVYRADLHLFQQYVNGAWENERQEDADSDWIDYAISASGWSDNGSRVRVVGNRVTLDLSVQRNGGTVASGPGVSVVLTTLDPEHRPAVNPEESGDVMAFAVHNGTSGGVGTVHVRPSTGAVELEYINREILNGDRLRGTYHYFLD